ncbi:MAG: myxococcus cysteine-rich repeat containing protein [Leptospira sp.]|nr:myxococcus cysteine-rich repeat containing protein [Leptospira sp.]
MKNIKLKLISLLLTFCLHLSCDLIKPEKESNESMIGAAGLALVSGTAQSSTNSTYPSSTTFSYTAGQSINLAPSNHVSGSTYSVSPSLPSGITLDTGTGVLSGSSTASLASTTYSITQTRPDGSTTIFTLTLEITGGTSSTTTTAATTPITNHTVGGSITGNLNSGTVVLRLNGANNLSRSATGAFVFGTTVSTNNTYAVTVFTQPTTSSCGVTANGSGTIVSSNITNVAVACDICGDGVKPSYQPCDDGNTNSGDGCSNVCTVEGSYTCVGSPSVCTN